MEKKINDFGMKIGGARKDKKEESKENPLPKMNNPGNFLLISRDNIWPETNGEELVASGVPQGIAYWREQIRKAIPPHPSKADERSMINYFNIVSELKEQVNQVNEPADVESFYHFIHQHYLTVSNDYPIFVTDPAKDVVSQKLLQEAQTKYCTYEHKAKKIFFGIPQKDKAALRKQQKEITQNNKPNPDSPYDSRKKPFPIPKLSTFMRNGPAYLPAGNHAGKEEFLALGIRGVEFGLWMSDADAQAALDQCYHALRDLAYVLDIAPEDISFGGKLALFFGTRGHGEVLADYQTKQEFDATLKSKDNVIMDLQDKLNKVRFDLKAAETAEKEKADENKRLTDTITALQNTLNDKNEKNKILSDLCNNLQCQVNAMQEAAAQTEALQEQIKHLEEERDKTIREYTALKEQIKQVQQQAQLTSSCTVKLL